LERKGETRRKGKERKVKEKESGCWNKGSATEKGERGRKEKERDRVRAQSTS
jgi:hypothetical protein